MHIEIKTNFSFYIFTLLMCLNSFFLTDTTAQDNTEPVVAPANANYTFETIEVPGVDFLAVTASSDFGGLRRLHEKCGWRKRCCLYAD